MPQKDLKGGIDTSDLGMMLEAHSPKSRGNRHRSKWRVVFDTGIEMLVPDSLFETMAFHLEQADYDVGKGK